LRKHVADGAFDQAQSDMDRICNATGRMARLLDTLLEVSRLGRIVSPTETIYKDELVHEAIELLSGRINKAGVRVTVMPELPTVVGDRPRWLEVIQNLLDNAVKYMGDQDEPLIEVGWEETPDETVMYVRDNGIGIHPRFHKKVLELFEQLDPTIEGSGVGLALVKRIVEIHGGRVWIESDGLSKGTTFYFTLPRSQAEKCQEVGQWTPGNPA
jgi:signal transduction histidine kinase